MGFDIKMDFTDIGSEGVGWINLARVKNKWQTLVNKIMNQNFIYSPTNALVSCQKKTILKFTLKQLRHVSVLQLHHHQGAH